MSNNCTVKVPDQGYEHGQEMLKWAKAHCPSLITNDARIGGLVETEMRLVDQDKFIRIYNFGNEQDATLFTLKFAG